MPPQITYYVACSADGFIADAAGGVGWLDRFQGTGEDYGYQEFFGSVDGLVMGRKTYEQIWGFGDWPYGEKPCWVVSSQPIPDRDNISTIDQSALSSKEKPWEVSSARHLWLVGGGTLAGAFASRNLIDRYMIFVMPCFLGRGIGLFGSHGAEFAEQLAMLQLSHAERYNNGVMLLDYHPPAKAEKPNG